MIVYKYLDENAALQTLENKCVLFRCPEQYRDHTDSLFFCSDEEKDKAYKLYINYLMFKNLREELIQSKSKPIKLKPIAKPYMFAMEEAYKLIKMTKRYTYQPYLAIFNKFINKYLDKKDKDLRIEFSKAINDSCKKIRDSALVTCFCKSCNERIMWDRYGGGYEGVCFGFDFDENNIREVEYVKKPISFNLHEAFEIRFGHEIAKCELHYDEQK